MKKLTLLLFALMLGTSAAEAAERDSVLMNFDWLFHLGELADGEKPGIDLTGWKQVNLPLDYQLNMPWNKEAKPSRGYVGRLVPQKFHS